jgi:sigma-B regulation protein RsbU (phosphoserine phosphatase)
MMAPMVPLEARPAQPSPTDDLDLIAEMSMGFAHTGDIEASLRRALERVTARLGAEAGSLFLLEGDELVCRACVGPTDVTGLRLKRGHGIVWRTVERNASQMVKDTRADPDFSGVIDASTGFHTRSVLCSPLSVRDQRLGAIELFNKTGGGSFLAADRRMLDALAASAALALFNTRLLANMAEQEALRRELALASDIQRAMLPGDLGPHCPVHGVNRPARTVSGDFYDVVELEGGRFAFAVADVAGKGVNAALLMAKTASLFRCLVKRLDGPGQLLAAIDAELNETGASGMFVTMVAGVLDTATGRVVLANAGHEPPMLFRGGAYTRIEGGLPPLGILPELFLAGCPETTIDLEGGRLYLFTDGLTEAAGTDGAMLGEDGVVRLLASHAHRKPADRLAAVVDEIAEAAGGTFRDDLTILVVEDRHMTGPALDRRFPARADTLCDIRRAVKDAVRGLGLGEAEGRDVVLAVDEACQNIIRHAYKGADGDIAVQLSKDGDRLVVRLIDFAPPVDATKICPRALDDLRPGGLGTHFIRSVMDEVAFLPPPEGCGNMLQMVKRMP